MQDKGKRKIADSQEGKKSYKMKEDPIIVKVALAAEEKREQWMKRVQRRKREKYRFLEVELKMQEMEKKLKE